MAVVMARPEIVPSIFITRREFARLAKMSVRTIDRYRKIRPPGFPAEYDVGLKERCFPRFKRAEVETWLDSLALW